MFRKCKLVKTCWSAAVNVRPIIIPKKVIFKKREVNRKKFPKWINFFLVWILPFLSSGGKGVAEGSKALSQKYSEENKKYETESRTEKFSANIYFKGKVMEAWRRKFACWETSRRKDLAETKRNKKQKKHGRRLKTS